MRCKCGYLSGVRCIFVFTILRPFDRDNPGRPVPEETFTYSHPSWSTLSHFSICNGPWHPLYSAYVLDSPLGQPLSRSSLVFLLVLNPQLHTPFISSPNHHHLFAAHAHAILFAYRPADAIASQIPVISCII